MAKTCLGRAIQAADLKRQRGHPVMMNRRGRLAWRVLVGCLLVLGLLVTADTAAADRAEKPPPGKKGVCLVTGKQNKDSWRHKVAALKVSWHYCWNAKIPDAEPKGVEFVPMVWRYSGNEKAFESRIREVMEMKRRHGATHLLGFNEPDRDKQANMTVEQAIKAWPVLQKTKLRLGSPAPAKATGPWLASFMKEAEKRNLRVDFICVHWYGEPNPEQFIRHLNKVHQMYGRPIWITEFAVADWKAPSVQKNRHSPKTVLNFMKEVLPKLDELDFVERYAWFPGQPENKALAPSALFTPAGQLTELGEFYASHPSRRE